MQPAKEFMWGKAQDARFKVEASLVAHWRKTSIPYLAYLNDREKSTTLLKKRITAIDKASAKLSKERQEIDSKLYDIREKAGERLYKHFNLKGYTRHQHNGATKVTYPNLDDGDIFRSILNNSTPVKALQIAWTKVEEAIYLGGSKKLGDILESFRATCEHLTK